MTGKTSQDGGSFDKFPTYQAVVSNYFDGPDVSLILHFIFKDEDADRMGNSCTARVSNALAGAGAKIPLPTRTDHGVLILPVIWDHKDRKHHDGPVLHVLPCRKSVDGACAIKVLEFATYLRYRFGPPTVEFSPPRTVKASESLAGRFGIICFVMKGDWQHTFHSTGAAAADGHIALWKGADFTDKPPASEDYFAKASSIAFWELPLR